MQLKIKKYGISAGIVSPLSYEGLVRQGKSTLVRLFASDMDFQLIEINLERHLYLDEVFKSLNIVNILAELEGIAGRIENPEKSLLFLDEVQATPHAIRLHKHFNTILPAVQRVRVLAHLLKFPLLL